MKPMKRKGRTGGSQGKESKRFASRELVLLDQAALRKKAASECSRQMARLEKAKGEWKRYETEDKAHFDQWMAATFGSVLSRLRELKSVIAEKEMLIEEVEMEVYFGMARSERAAYADVQDRRDNPPPPYEPPPRGNAAKEADAADFDDISELEQEILFQNFIEAAMGMFPDCMTKAEYEKMFAEFKAKMSDKGREAPQSEPPTPEQGRLKEIYRQLVRRLHPDTRDENAADVSALWHEVQDAYSTGNIERLETLLALTDLQSNTTGEHTSMSQMKSVLTELRRSFNALQRNLRQAKNGLAWNFSRMEDRSKIQQRMRQDLSRDIALYEERLGLLEAKIASWATPSKGRKKRATRHQSEFGF